MIHPQRKRIIHSGSAGYGPVIYWMSRDQRAEDNWALLLAQREAMERQRPLHVVFTLVSGYPGATWRTLDFMLKGLQETAATLRTFRIPFHVLFGDPLDTLPAFLERKKAALLVTDFDPLRIKRRWKLALRHVLKIQIVEVDTHNVVPCRVASDKQEYAAYTIRPKIHRLLDEFLDPIVELFPHPFSPQTLPDPPDWPSLENRLNMDRTVSPVTWLKPGSAAGREVLNRFIRKRLSRYDEARNDPNCEVQSDLSPYLHFGQISPQRVAHEVLGSGHPARETEPFLEELIVRRELADNFCYYNPDYDSVEAFPAWARDSLQAHHKDPRPAVYSDDQLERAETHDPLWNAAQNQMRILGKMHGYLRMYWAKKILEWTEDPAHALKTALMLNDKYELDGRDPNGITGCAWSIGGVHDRAWPQRPVFGKIRFMSLNGARNKFNVNAFVESVRRLEEA